MSGDLEDFLRRAAQRRQAKAAQQQPAPRKRQPPQYSDRRTERVARVPEIDEVLTAEVVEDDSESFAARLRRVEAAKQAAAKAQAVAAQKRTQSGAGVPKSADVAASVAENPAHELLRILRQPGGLRHAILLREVLDRPEHRW